MANIKEDQESHLDASRNILQNQSPKMKSNDTSHFGVTEQNMKNSAEITYASDLEHKPPVIKEHGVEIAYQSNT